MQNEPVRKFCAYCQEKLPANPVVWRNQGGWLSHFCDDLCKRLWWDERERAPRSSLSSGRGQVTRKPILDDGPIAGSRERDV